MHLSGCTSLPNGNVSCQSVSGTGLWLLAIGHVQYVQEVCKLRQVLELGHTFSREV